MILREFYVERETPYFADYARRFTDLPFLVRLTERGDAHVAGRLPHARPTSGDGGENAEAKTVVWDAAAGAPAVPERLDRLPLGRRGRRALEPRPRGRGARPSRSWTPARPVAVDLPRFDVGETEGGGVDAPRRPGAARSAATW